MSARRVNGRQIDEPLDVDVRILRRIPPRGVHPSDPTDRPQSWRFAPKKGEDGLSVDIWENGNSPEDTIKRADKGLPPGEEYGIVYLTVGDVRGVDLEVVRDPQPDNPFHALIKGKFTRSKRKKLSAKSSRGWIKKPNPEHI